MSSASKTALRSRSQIVWATLGSFLLGVFVVVAVVLPAEYSLDPLGIGKTLGVLGLAENGATAVAYQSSLHKTDAVSFRLAPFESFEYSYRMQLGAVLVYSWYATGEVVFNLHSTPDTPFSELSTRDSAADLAQSFSSGRGLGEQGTYTAPFTGQHGWFFENRTNAEVTLELATAGFMGDSLHSSVSGQQSASPASALSLP